MRTSFDQLARWALRLGAATLLAACVTTDRTAEAYDACDRQVGLCYETCRAETDEAVRAACQERCGTEVNACFAQVAGTADRRVFAAPAIGVPAVSATVFYGRNGYWSPYDGWRFGPHGRRYSYAPYGFGLGPGRLGYGRFGHGRARGHGFGAYGFYGAHPVRGETTRPRWNDALTGGDASVPTEERVTGADGGVFAGDGRRLRYGGKPNRSRSAERAIPKAARVATPRGVSRPEKPRRAIQRRAAPPLREAPRNTARPATGRSKMRPR